MPGRTIELPKSGFALEIDGRLKTEFSTKEGAEHGAIELKRRFPMLQIRIYDAGTPVKTRFARLGADVHGPGRGRRCRPRPPDVRIFDVIERQPPPASHVRLAPPPRR
jgi:hypothetical protein